MEIFLQARSRLKTNFKSGCKGFMLLFFISLSFTEVQAVQQQDYDYMLTKNRASEQVTAHVLEKTISVDFNNVRLRRALQAIAQKADLELVYSSNLVPTSKRITFQKRNVKVKKALWYILSGTDLRFSLTNHNHLVLMKVKSENKKSTQTGTVSGVVKDAETGEILPGANVYLLSDKSVGGMTDKSGHFELNNVEVGMHIVAASFVGYQTQQKRLMVNEDETTNIEFLLKTSINSLQNTLVTGYYSIPKERATGSFSHVTEEQLSTVNSLSIRDKLNGLVPGLLYQPNYNSDQSPTLKRDDGLTIRGNSTLGDNSPLIVVDGFPVNSSEGVDPWSTINPDDVKNITVLKDAAAASIWGDKAANGVIVVETKKGRKSGKPTVSASINYLVQPAPDLYEIPFMSSSESIDLYKSLILDGSDYDPLMQDYFRKQYELPEAINVLVKMKAGEISQSAGNERLNQLSKIDARDEFSDLFFRDMESNTKFNLSYSNGNEYTRTRVSVSAVQRNKYSIGDSGLQFLTNIQNEFKPTDWLTTNFNVNYSITKNKNNGIAIGEIENIPQMSHILDENGDYKPMVRYSYPDLYYDTKTSFRRDLVEQYGLPYDWDWNIEREQRNKDQTEDKNDIRLSGKLRFTPIKQLQVDLSYQYQQNQSLVQEYYNEDSWYVRNLVNLNARKDGSYPVPPGGMLYENKSHNTSHDGRVQLRYNDSFGESDLRVLGGMEIRKKLYSSIPDGYYGYDPQSLTHVSNLDFQTEINPKITGDDAFVGATIPPIPTLSKSSIRIRGRDDRFLSYYGNLGYTYMSKYDLTGSIRLDQTNLYGRSPSYQNLPQWSVGLGWDISDESFFNIKNVDNLKLRMSYGWNGHIDKNASPYITGTPWVDPVNNLQYASVQQTPNPALTWEKTANYNVGIDFAVFESRLTGSIDAYIKKSKDVLADVEKNGTYGFYYDEATINNGNIENKGIEIDLSSLVIDKKIKWQTGFNYSFNKNVAQNVETSASRILARTAQSQFNPVNGQPTDYIAVAKWAGYSDEGLPQVYYGDEVKDVTEINYNNADLDKLFYFAGQRSPKHFGSWSNAISYNNFKFSFRLNYSFGNKFFKDTPPRNLFSDYTSFRNFFTFNTELLSNRWQSPDDSETASMYSLDADVNFLTQLTTDYIAKYNSSNLLDAGQVRLKNIELTYTIPPTFIKAIKHAQIQIQARNLGPIFLKNDEGIDPSFPKYSGSLYSAFYNIVRDRPTYSINLKIGI